MQVAIGRRTPPRELLKVREGKWVILKDRLRLLTKAHWHAVRTESDRGKKNVASEFGGGSTKTNDFLLKNIVVCQHELTMVDGGVNGRWCLSKGRRIQPGGCWNNRSVSRWGLAKNGAMSPDGEGSRRSPGQRVKRI